MLHLIQDTPIWLSHQESHLCDLHYVGQACHIGVRVGLVVPGRMSYACLQNNAGHAPSMCESLNVWKHCATRLCPATRRQGIGKGRKG